MNPHIELVKKRLADDKSVILKEIDALLNVQLGLIGIMLLIVLLG